MESQSKFDAEAILRETAPSFNKSAILFHKNEFSKASNDLQKLFSALTGCRNVFDVRLCFLTLEVLLRLAATDGLYSAEELQSFGSNTQAVFTMLNRCKSIEASALTHSIIEFRTHIYRCRVLSLQRDPKGSRREIKNAMETFQHGIRTHLEGESKQPDVISGSADQNQSAFNLKANLEFQKVPTLLLCLPAVSFMRLV